MSDFWVRGVLDGMRDAEPMYQLGWRTPDESYPSIDDVFHDRIRNLADLARDLASVRHRERLEAAPEGFASNCLDYYRLGYFHALEVELARLTRGSSGVDFTTFSDAVLCKVAAVLNETLNETPARIPPDDVNKETTNHE